MTVLLNDTFARTAQSGWGTSTDGQAWTVRTTGPTLSIASNQGIINGTTSGDSVLGSKSSIPVDIRVRFAFGNAGDGTMFGINFRTTNVTNYYFWGFLSGTSLGFRCNTTSLGAPITLGTATTISTVTGTEYWLRVRAVGSILQGKWWTDGSAEPAAWTQVVTDTNITTTGNIGFQYSPGSTNNNKIDFLYAVDYPLQDTLTTSDSIAFSNGSVSSMTGTDTTTVGTDVYKPTDVYVPTDTLTSTENTTQTVVFVATDILTLSDTLKNTSVYAAVDTLVSTESAASIVFYTATDVLIETEVTTQTFVYATSDTLTETEITTQAFAYTLADTLTEIETTTYTVLFSASDSMVTTEASTTGQGWVPVDTLAETESTTYGEAFAFVDALTAIDATSVTLGVTNSDTTSLSSDSISNANISTVNLVDVALSVTDSILLALVNASGNDVSTETETLSIALSVVSFDAINVSDAFTSSTASAVNLLDVGLTLTETYTEALAFSSTDTLIASDIFVPLGITTATLSDVGLVVTETYTEAFAFSSVDTSTISDVNTTFALTETYVDATVIAIETFVLTGGINSSDTATTNDVFFFVQARSISDVAPALQDATTFTLVEALIDSALTLQDSLTFPLFQAFTDSTLVTTDTITGTPIIIAVDISTVSDTLASSTASTGPGTIIYNPQGNKLINEPFTRANQSGWGTSADGVTWTHPGGAGTLAITNNAATIVSSSTTKDDMVYGSTTYTDSVAEVIATLGTTSDIVGLGIRASTTALNKYRATINGPNTSFDLVLVSSGNATTLATKTGITWNAGTQYMIKAQAIGSSLWAKYWPIGTAEPAAWTLGPITDTTVTSGMFSLLGLATTATAVTFDNLYAIDYTLADTPLALVDASSMGVSNAGTYATLTDSTLTLLETCNTVVAYASSDTLSETEISLETSINMLVDTPLVATDAVSYGRGPILLDVALTPSETVLFAFSESVVDATVTIIENPTLSESVWNITVPLAPSDGITSTNASSGPISAPQGKFLLSDTFARANQTGWGTASDGKIWNVRTPGPTLAITNNEGTFNGTTYGDAVLGSLTASQVDVRLRFTFGNAGDGTMFGINFRTTTVSDYYFWGFISGTQVGFRYSTTALGAPAALGTPTTITATSGTVYWLRVCADKTHLMGKWWADGSPEPAAWTQQIIDSTIVAAGNIGLQYAPGSTTNNSVDSLYAIDNMLTDTPLMPSESIASYAFVNASQLTGVDTVSSPVENFVTSSTTNLVDMVAGTEILTTASSYAPFDLTNDTLLQSEILQAFVVTTGAIDVLNVNDVSITTLVTFDATTLNEYEISTYALGETLTDTSTTLDTFSVSSFYASSDTTLIFDTAQIGTVFSASDGLTVQETGAPNVVALGSDALSTSEVGLYTPTILFTDMVLASELSLYTSTNLTADTLTLTETTQVLTPVTLVDTLLVSGDGFLALQAFSTNEYVTSSDLEQSLEFYTSVDAITVDDSASTFTSFARFVYLTGTDAFVINESLNTAITWTLPVEIYLPLDVSTMTLSVAESSSIGTIFDTFISQQAAMSTDAINASETMIEAFAWSYGETTTLLPENLTASIVATNRDSVSTVETYVVGIIETGNDTLTESTAQFVALTMSFSDSVAITETLSTFFAITVPFTESTSFPTDSVTSLLFTTNSDALLSNDTLLTSESVKSQDSVIPLDTLFIGATSIPVDGITSTDTVTTLLSSAFSDALIVNDASSTQAIFTPVDTALSNDTCTSFFALSLLDSITVTEQEMTGSQVRASDSVTSIDMLGNITVVSMADVATTTDILFPVNIFVTTDASLNAFEGLFVQSAWSTRDTLIENETLASTKNVALLDIALVPYDAPFGNGYSLPIDTLFTVETLSYTIAYTVPVLGIVRSGIIDGYGVSGVIDGIIRSGNIDGTIH